jgi:predicted GH43/DUF377 family glycosyl hydrolase
VVVVKRHNNNLIKKRFSIKYPTIHNVVFACGAIPKNNETSKLYWGRAGIVMAIRMADIGELVDEYLTHRKKTI